MTATERRFYEYAVGKARYRDRLYFGADGRAAAELGLSRRTIIRCRASLERQGYLRRCGQRRWRGGKMTVCYAFPRRRVTQRSTCRETKPLESGLRPASRRCRAVRRLRMTDGQRLVSFYVDECIAQNRPGMTRMKGHMAKRARELYDAIRETPGYDDERAMRETLAALREFVRRDMKTPMALAELSLELVRNESPVARERPEARRRAKDWIAENGWPTGARFVHGTHSGSYVFDPLGTEPIPRGYDWPYRRPTFDDVVEALA